MRLRSWRARFLVAVGVLFVVWGSLPYVDRRLPFRFDRYDGILGFGPVNVDRANSAFLETFPARTPASVIESYFDRIGGHCYPPDKDQAQQIDCFWGHGLVPCLARLWGTTITFDPSTSALISARVGENLDGC